jgi:hypothetical protein
MRGNPVQQNGWWIRVNPQNQATEVRWEIRAKPKGDLTDIKWTQEGNQNAFDLPEPLRSADSLHLSVTATPAEATASFCIFYKDRGVALAEFSRRDELQLNQRRSEPKCVP